MATLEGLLESNHSMGNQTQGEGEENHLFVAKATAMVVLCLASFLVGVVPVKLTRWFASKSPSEEAEHSHGPSQQPFVISVLLCFGGGVLLFTTFLHLQPEVREAMQHLQRQGLVPDVLVKTGISLADLVFCCGFFFVYIVEEIVHCVLDRRPHEQEDEAVLHRTMSLRRCSRHPHEHDHQPSMIPRASLSNGQTSKSDSAESNGSMSASTHGLLKDSHISTIDMKTSGSPLDPTVHMTGGPLGHEEEDDSHSEVVAKSFRGLLAVLALSFHAVFEGLAVGLETSPANVWYLFGAIATHKLVIAFCVGVELVSSRTRLPLVIVYLATFAVVTPIGIGAGITLGDSGGGNNAVAVVLQGMAAGTLLYVVFFEVLQRERSNTQSGAWQLFAIMAGFAIMLGLQIVMGHEHSHGGKEHHEEDHEGHIHDHAHDHGDHHR